MTADDMRAATWYDINMVDAFVIIPKAVLEKRLEGRCKAHYTSAISSNEAAKRQADTHHSVCSGLVYMRCSP